MIKLNTNHGTIVLELDAAKAPNTVANFLQYAKDGFYDGTIFHRVINGFMIQGGGMEPGMAEKQTRAPIQNEANNGLTNARGTIAMARTPDPHSATAQFFINVADNDFLNFRAETPDGWGYCVFGKVTDGMDVVDKIKGVDTGNKGYHQDVPVEDVVIESVEVDE
ncbi:MAG: peptidylprolyl isomerase [Gammaproteobacteria bacterium]|nr:peptidylprolyl isomerase [Gammaproteobacteria bacterium]